NSFVSAAPSDNLKPNACISCQRRKVRCDRTEPCASCRRYRAQCEYRDPAPRRKRKLSDDSLHAKLDRYEQIINSLGNRSDGPQRMSAPEQPTPQPSSRVLESPGSNFTAANVSRTIPLHNENLPASRDADIMASKSLPGHSARPAHNGQLIYENGTSKYIENHLWKGLRDEFRSPREILNSTSAIPEDEDHQDPYEMDENDMVLGRAKIKISLRSLHPPSEHIFLLWQAFLDNVNPLVKLFHAPTVQRQILKVCSNLDAVEPGFEALMFSIYLFAVTSMSSQECLSNFRESRASMLSRFRYATTSALSKAGFLRSSELVVLQAYVLFLLALRPYYDIHTLWSLTGIAFRMSQRIGLHRDGATLGLPVFDVEMRRRAWWQVIPLEFRTAELCGAANMLVNQNIDMKLALNVNDSELSPDMKQLPIEHEGPTEMFFCRLRGTMGRFMQSWKKFEHSSTTVAEKDAKTVELEQLLHDKILRYVDTSIPLHLLSLIVAQSAVNAFKLRAHHPRLYPDKGASLPQSEKDFLFSTALKIVELDNMAHSEPSIAKFLWHMDAWFQWDGFIYVLSELRTRTAGEEANRAWFQVNKVFEHHHEILTVTNNPLHIGICNITVKAWEAWTADAVR
ncbi:hypothetical protein K490DRAFT_4184, partial [Saccharata proteae CBS 121410]